MGKFDGQVAIITGASRGLGRAIALKLAEEGANLLVVARSMAGLEETKKLVETQGGRATVARVDTSNEKDILRMADLAVKELGGIDILVNNAAIGIERKPFFEISTEEWDRVMTVNVRGYWLCVKAVFPHMKNKQKGKIINITSDTFFTGSHNFAHYVSSKGGIIGLTRALARELGDYGIRINAVAPGFLANEAGLALIGGDKSTYDVKPNCIKRVGTSEDIVGAVMFLASNESDFITGQIIAVNGGRVLH
jgi:3-oxoacyl-[acyl-carrier protein] reductase